MVGGFNIGFVGGVCSSARLLSRSFALYLVHFPFFQVRGEVPIAYPGGPVHSCANAWQLRLCNSPLLSGSVRCYIAIMNRAVPICANAWLRQ